MRGDTLCHAAFDAVTKSSRTPMRDPENTVFGHPVLQCSSLVIPSSMRTVSSRTPMRDPGIPAVYTAGNRPDSRDARSVHPTSNLYPQRSMSSFPLFFSRKRKGKAKRKLPADVRKLKNDCEARGKRTRRARFAAAVRQALLPRALRLIRPGSNIFSLHSSLSAIFPSAFSHRPDGFALRSCRTWMRFPSHPAQRCGIQKYPPLSSRPPMQHQVMPCFDAASRNTCKVTRKIHFPGPRIAVRGDVKHRSAVRQR